MPKFSNYAVIKDTSTQKFLCGTGSMDGARNNAWSDMGHFYKVTQIAKRLAEAARVVAAKKWVEGNGRIRCPQWGDPDYKEKYQDYRARANDQYRWVNDNTAIPDTWVIVPLTYCFTEIPPIPAKDWSYDKISDLRRA